MNERLGGERFYDEKHYVLDERRGFLKLWHWTVATPNIEDLNGIIASMLSGSKGKEFRVRVIPSRVIAPRAVSKVTVS